MKPSLYPSTATVSINDQQVRHQEKVMIIDDEADICFLLGKILDKLSCKVKIATSLTKGIVEICNMLPDIVFLDINFPDGSSGLECIKLIRLCSPKTEIIMMSAMDGIAERQKAKKEGASYFISKPFTDKAVAKVIREIIH